MIIKNNDTFHLQGKSISYIITLNETGDLLHYHFGNKMADRDYSLKNEKFAFSWIPYDENNIYLETVPQEYPGYGYADLRYPAYSVRNKFGNSVSRLLFKEYEIKENQVAKVKGMPSIPLKNGRLHPITGF